MRTSPSLLLSSLLLGATACAPTVEGDLSSAEAVGRNKVDVCHVTGNGSVREINVSSSAVDAHLDHGDSLPATWYFDGDEDGFGDAADSVSDCAAPSGYVADASDCDDADGAVSPAAAEVPYDGTDNDCDAATPDDDLDGDGHGIATDCDDADGAVNPDAAEVAYDGLDNDCDAATPDDDLDGDGYGIADDCDDGDASLNLDDADADGVSTCDGDWDDVDATSYPGAPETCDDSIDNNGDGTVDEGCAPATEVCGDGIDNDGDGDVDERCDNGVGELCVEVLLHCNPASQVLQTFCGSGVQPVVGQVRSNASYILLGAGVNGAIIRNSGGTVVTITEDTNLCGLSGFNDRLVALEVF